MCLYCTVSTAFALRTRNPKSPNRRGRVFVTLEHMVFSVHMFAEHKFPIHRHPTGFSQKLSTLSTGFSTGYAVKKPDFSRLFWETVKKSPQLFEQLWRFPVNRTLCFPLLHIQQPCRENPAVLAVFRAVGVHLNGVSSQMP